MDEIAAEVEAELASQPVSVQAAESPAAVRVAAASVLDYAADEAPAKKPRALSPAHLAILAAAEASDGVIDPGDHHDWPKPVAARIFSAAAKRLQTYPDLDTWRAVGAHLAAERPGTMDALSFVTSRRWDAWVVAAKAYAARLARIGGDPLHGPRLLAAELERAHAPVRLHVGELRALAAKDVHALVALQLVRQPGTGEQGARDAAEWRLLASWVAAGGLAWMQRGEITPADLARYGEQWLAKARAWDAAGRKRIAPPKGALAQGPSTTADYERAGQVSNKDFARKYLERFGG